MSVFWNIFPPVQPPFLSYEATNQRIDLKALRKPLTEMVNSLEDNKMLHIEVAILDRQYYKAKLYLRRDKSTSLLARIKKSLNLYLNLGLLKMAKQFLSFIPLVYSFDNHFPSRQVLEGLLVRLQAFGKLMCRIVELCQTLGTLVLQKLKIGHTFNRFVMMLASCSRVWLLCKDWALKCCDWYRDLLPFRDQFRKVGAKFLPQGYSFPVDLSVWLNCDWLTTIVDLDLIPDVPIFSLLEDSDNDDDCMIIDGIDPGDDDCIMSSFEPAPILSYTDEAKIDLCSDTLSTSCVVLSDEDDVGEVVERGTNRNSGVISLLTPLKMTGIRRKKIRKKERIVNLCSSIFEKTTEAEDNSGSDFEPTLLLDSPKQSIVDLCFESFSTPCIAQKQGDAEKSTKLEDGSDPGFESRLMNSTKGSIVDLCSESFSTPCTVLKQDDVEKTTEPRSLLNSSGEMMKNSAEESGVDVCSDSISTPQTENKCSVYKDISMDNVSEELNSVLGMIPARSKRKRKRKLTKTQRRRKKRSAFAPIIKEMKNEQKYQVGGVIDLITPPSSKSLVENPLAKKTKAKRKLKVKQKVQPNINTNRFQSPNQSNEAGLSKSARKRKRLKENSAPKLNT